MPISDPDLMHMPTVAMLSSVSHTKPLCLLAAAEESFCQAASVLQPAITAWKSDSNAMGPDLKSRLNTGLHLLEEAMKSHNRYMQSLQ